MVPGTLWACSLKLQCACHYVKIFKNCISVRTTPLWHRNYHVCCTEGTGGHRGLIICPGYAARICWSSYLKSEPTLQTTTLQWSCQSNAVLSPLNIYRGFSMYVGRSLGGKDHVPHKWYFKLFKIFTKDLWIPQRIWTSYSKNKRLQQFSCMFCFFHFCFCFGFAFSC